MRPEMMEYNYDWLMAQTMAVASKVPNGTPKEIEMAYGYMPSYSNVARAFVEAGEVGTGLLTMFHQYFQNILTAHREGKKLALITFCFSPAVLYAMDVVPVCTELLTALGNMLWRRGMFDYLDHACQVGLPETSCSSQRGCLGAYFAGLGEEIDLVICDTPGVCDTNANAFAFTATFLNKPFYQLNFPHVLNDDDVSKYHIDDYKEMIKFIEEQTGNKMDYDRFGEVLQEVKKQDELIADLEDMHALKPTPIPPLFNLATYAGRFSFTGTKEYTVLLQSMHKVAKDNIAAGRSGLKSGVEKLRAFMIYIDHYTLDLNFWNWFDQNNIAHMGGILSHHFSSDNDYGQPLDGAFYKIDTSSPEGMLDTLAQLNARMPMVRSIRGPYDQPNMWLEETLVLGKHFGVDCMIYNGTPGCRNTWANLKLMARDCEKHGYPVHIMMDDAFDDRVENWEATKDRLDEFFKVRGLL